MKKRMFSAAFVFAMAVAFLGLAVPSKVYAATDYTVTFDSNGGSSVNSQTVAEGAKATKPEDPTNGELKFLGWFENPTVENLYNLETNDYNTFNFDTVITKDTTLTAVWVARLSVNIEGMGQISIAEAGKTPEFDDEFPAQSAIEASYIGLYDSFVVGAKAEAGYKFVKWENADTNKTYSKDPQINVTVRDNMSLVAVFEYDHSIATKVSVAAAGYTGTTYTLLKGKTLTLTPTVSPAKASQKVTYKSNNTKVAKVNEKGKVTAVKAGTAKITVTAADGSGKKQNVTVRVVKNAAANKELTLKKTTATLKKKGASAQITIGNITKGTTDKITYKVTSGSKLISVDKLGVVTAKKAPTSKKQTAKVTVKCGTKSAIYTVTLKK